MLSTLVCTMVLTLGVDAGWKPAEDGKSSNVYVIRIDPDQARQKIATEGHVTSDVPPGPQEVRIQFGGNDILLKDPPRRSLPAMPPSDLAPKPNETDPFGLPSTPPPPPSDVSPYTLFPEPSPPEEPSATGAIDNRPIDNGPSDIVTTSLNTPVKVDDHQPITPKENVAPPSAQSATSKPSLKAAGAAASDEAAKPSEPSYLATAIASWIVSAALVAVIFYLGLIHLDLRRRYQILLNRMLPSGDPSNDPAGDPSAQRFQSPLPMDPQSTIPLSAATPLLSPLPPEPAGRVPAENDSASEPSVQQSTLVESEATSAEKEAASKANEPDPDQVSVNKLNLGGASLLLKNTNQVISQVPGEEELEAEDPRGKAAEPETVYGLPETSDDHETSDNQPSDERDDDDEDDWEGVK